MTRSEIVAVFGADTKQVDQALRSMSHKFKDGAKEMAASFAAPWKAIGASLLGKFSYDGLQEMSQHFKEVKHAAEQSGTSIEFMVGAMKSFKKAGLDPEVAVKALGKFEVKMGEARTGTESAAASFKKWSVSLYDANGDAMNTEAMLPIIADKMKGIEDPALRAAMAFDLFGKQGISLVPILAQGGAAVEAWKAKSKTSSADAQAVIDLGNNLKVAGDWAESLAAKLVNKVASALKLLGWDAQGNKKGILSGLFGGDNEDQMDRITRIAEAFGKLSVAKKLAAVSGAGGLVGFLAQVEKDRMEPINKKKAEEEAEGAKAAARAMAGQRLEDAQKRFKESGMTQEEHLTAMNGEYSMLQNQLEKVNAESEQGLEIQTKMLGIAEKIRDEEKKIADEKKKAAEALAKQQEDAEKKWADAATALATAKKERLGFTIEQLAGKPLDEDWGAGMTDGVRGGRRRRLARRAQANARRDQWNYENSPDDPEARGLAGDYMANKEQIDRETAVGHWNNARDLMQQNDSILSSLPDWLKPSLDPLGEQLKRMTETATALKRIDDLILNNGNALPVGVKGAAQ